MSKRTDADHSQSDDDTMVAETLRASAAPHPPKRSDDEKVSLFWRVFGGTILSVAALAALTLFNTVTSHISELRTEVNRLNEAKVDAAKKDEVVALKAQAETNRHEIDGLKERLSKYRLELDATKEKQAAAEKDMLKSITEAREKIARIEGQQTPMPIKPIPVGEGK